MVASKNKQSIITVKIAAEKSLEEHTGARIPLNTHSQRVVIILPTH
jgi:hypothetical protein